MPKLQAPKCFNRTNHKISSSKGYGLYSIYAVTNITSHYSMTTTAFVKYNIIQYVLCEKNDWICWDTLTKVELAVDFFTVDDVELIRNASLHVAHFEVEPLMMMVRVDVAAQYQVILVLANLRRQQPTRYATGTHSHSQTHIQPYTQRDCLSTESQQPVQGCQF